MIAEIVERQQTIQFFPIKKSMKEKSWSFTIQRLRLKPHELQK